MTVNFYTSFSKRINSTLQPSGSSTAHDCKLKENCSVHDPVLILSTNTFNYEYAYIATWGKYYFITDCVSLANGLVEYHLTEDVLATYKTQIGNLYAHVLYSASNYDRNIIDSRIQVKSTRTLLYSEDTNALFGGGCYILTAYASEPGNASGMALSWALTQAGMAKVREWLGTNTVFAALANYFNGNPLEAILSLVWVPYDFYQGDHISTPADYVYIGNQSSGLLTTGTAREIIGYPIIYRTRTLNVNLRYTDFRAYEPYTKGSLYLPGAGLVDINMGDFRNSASIVVNVCIEAITGNVQYYICRADGTVVQTVKCNVASQCPLGQVTMNGSGVLSGIGQTVGAVAALGAAVATEGASMVAAAAGGAVVAGVANTVMAANQRGVSLSGGFNGYRIISAYDNVMHFEYSIDTEDPDDSDYIVTRGRPHDGVERIGDLSGYVQCMGASVAGSMNGKEKEEINTFLNNGFYYQ